MADYRFFWSMIKKKSRHTSFYLQNSNLPFDMRSNDSWPAHDSFPMILENRNQTGCGRILFPPISFRFKDMEAAGMIRKEGTEYLHLHRKKKMVIPSCCPSIDG